MTSLCLMRSVYLYTFVGSSKKLLSSNLIGRCIVLLALQQNFGNVEIVYRWVEHKTILETFHSRAYVEFVYKWVWYYKMGILAFIPPNFRVNNQFHKKMFKFLGRVTLGRSREFISRRNYFKLVIFLLVNLCYDA